MDHFSYGINRAKKMEIVNHQNTKSNIAPSVGSQLGVAMAFWALIFPGAIAQTHEGMISGQGAEIGEKNRTRKAKHQTSIG